MYFFKPEQEIGLSQRQRSKLYLADRLIEDIDKALAIKDKNNLPHIKSAILDIVVLERVLNRLGFHCSLEGELKKIRNSLAHIDERMDKFNFNSIELSGFEVTVEREDERFKKTVNINFQGAVDQAGIGIPIESDGDASVNTVSLFGMVDDWFMWVDKNGNQQATRLNEIVECYRTMLSTIKQ